jgi:hypothetical protein
MTNKELRIRLTDSKLYYEFKTRCIKLDKSMTKVLIELIKKFLEKETKDETK